MIEPPTSLLEAAYVHQFVAAFLKYPVTQGHGVVNSTYVRSKRQECEIAMKGAPLNLKGQGY